MNRRNTEESGPRPDETTASIERRGLLTSVVGAVVVAANGLVFGLLTGAQAILLDGFFNLTYFATGLFTIKVANLLRRGDDEQFPVGYAFFEPLVNGIKGVLLLGVTLIALVGAEHPASQVDLLFTQDERWSAPLDIQNRD